MTNLPRSLSTRGSSLLARSEEYGIAVWFFLVKLILVKPIVPNLVLPYAHRVPLLPSI